MTSPILIKIREKIRAHSLSLQEAATAIGIGASALERHLSGEYVRSDSMAKYRMWLEGVPRQSNAQSIPQKRNDAWDGMQTPRPPIADMDDLSIAPQRPINVVDLFCGCGGMSLGFERFDEGRVYRVAMALDIEAPMVKVFNDNHPSPSGDLPIARRSDITDFMSEAEIQGYYLDHLARSTGDTALANELTKLGNGGITSLRKRLKELDQEFLDNLYTSRSDADYISAVRQLGSATLGQTSVTGFHNATKLPLSGASYPKLGPLIWHQDGVVQDAVRPFDAALDDRILRSCRTSMRKLWDSEVGKLRSRASGAGRGQLASAAERILRFLDFLEGACMRDVKAAWVEWRATREALRRTFFEAAHTQTLLKKIYEDGRQVAVLLGGPPCQGFSRIGRGKIRSLKEQSVHVHEDEDSVDSRNLLMHQYVLFIAALAPKVFLFENVRHFQAVVKSEGIVFDAADILAEAIESVSKRGLGYAVSRKIVVASQHAVPQARERFVMAGVRKQLSKTLSSVDAASWCLSLSHRRPVPLQVALEELPDPNFSNQGHQAACPLENGAHATLSDQASDIYRAWTFRGTMVDAHLARPPRPDDEAFFSLMGPGKRWMDYRCDDSQTLQRIAEVLTNLESELKGSPELGRRLGISCGEVEDLVASADGSLSLRLLLESIPPQPGELQHHLLTTTYLRKREGAHGDWLSRMDPAQPSKTIVSHMAKDTYAFVHPFLPRTLSVREAARVQAFPDDYKFGSVGLVDGFRVVGNAVPPLLSLQFAQRVAQVLFKEDVVSLSNKPSEAPITESERLATT